MSSNLVNEVQDGSLISSIFRRWGLRKYQNSNSELQSVTFASVHERQYRKGEGLMFGSRTDMATVRVWILTLPLTNCVTLWKILNPSKLFSSTVQWRWCVSLWIIVEFTETVCHRTCHEASYSGYCHRPHHLVIIM